MSNKRSVTPIPDWALAAVGAENFLQFSQSSPKEIWQAAGYDIETHLRPWNRYLRSLGFTSFPYPSPEQVQAYLASPLTIGDVERIVRITLAEVNQVAEEIRAGMVIDSQEMEVIRLYRAWKRGADPEKAVQAFERVLNATLIERAPKGSRS